MNIPFAEVNLVAAVLATVASMLLGMLWYSPKGLFGKQWMQLTNAAPSKEEAMSAMWKGWLNTFVGVYFLGLILQFVGVPPMKEALTLSFIIWLLLSSNHLGGVIWDKVPFKLYAIHVGHGLVSILAAAAILTYWG